MKTTMTTGAAESDLDRLIRCNKNGEAFAGPVTHRSALMDHEWWLLIRPNKRQSRGLYTVAVLLFLVGFSMAYVSFVIGSVLLFFALDFTVGLWYQTKWLQKLKEYELSLETSVGEIVERKRIEHPGIDKVTYSVYIRYQYDEKSKRKPKEIDDDDDDDDDDNDSHLYAKKHFNGVEVASQELYQFPSSMIDMKIVPGKTQSGIPTMLLHRKLHDFRQKDLLYSGFMIAVGWVLYPLGAYYYGLLVGNKLVMWGIAGAAPLLMLPFILWKNWIEHKVYLHLLLDDLCHVPTRMDKLREFWKRTGPILSKWNAFQALHFLGWFLWLGMNPRFVGIVLYLGLQKLCDSTVLHDIVMRYCSSPDMQVLFVLAQLVNIPSGALCVFLVSLLCNAYDEANGT